MFAPITVILWPYLESITSQEPLPPEDKVQSDGKEVPFSNDPLVTPQRGKQLLLSNKTIM